MIYLIALAIIGIAGLMIVALRHIADLDELPERTFYDDYETPSS